jgi:hypothetical protein
MANRKPAQGASKTPAKLTSEVLERQMDEFLQAGGTVQVIPKGKSSYSNLPTTHSIWSKPKPENKIGNDSQLTAPNKAG